MGTLLPEKVARLSLNTFLFAGKGSGVSCSDEVFPAV